MSDNVGQSYNEQILQSIIDGSQYVNENPYPSRIEVLLMELKEAIEGGGGSVVVDQTYSAESTNAQSGTAVAEALETIPAQINADWDATEGAAVILHKPTIDSTPTEASTNSVQSGGVYTALAGKVDKVSGKGLSTNDYTNADKTALGTLQTDVDGIKTELSRSVLGNTDLNTLTAAGNYTCNANANTYTNAPSELTTGTYTLLMVRATASNRYFQIILSWTNAGDIYIRTLTTGTSPSATAWKKLTAVALEV